ncbi:MAG: 3'(2'),5'-bisphosphate nucleotidase CysQ [Desulfovibrionaceae bacterium]|nr:3'(2'),5'-bisphosphate nucleotidase CysQ [Desulfovibrionaceae bacterium]
MGSRSATSAAAEMAASATLDAAFAAAEIAEIAGREIMAVYRRGFTVRVKADDSPVTEADMASHHLLLRELDRAFPGTPVVSEEDADRDPAARAADHLLVDPLDGTRQFVRRNGEFVVNVALVSGGRAVWGVIHAPALGVTYLGAPGAGALRIEPDGTRTPIHAAAPVGPDAMVVLKSHSRTTPRQDAWLAARCIRPLRRPAVGSALKFCMVAEGTAHLAPCLHATCEWDTAAGQALVEAAGGAVTDAEGAPFVYAKADLRNPWYVAQAWPGADRGCC